LRRTTQVFYRASYAIFLLFAGRVCACWLHSAVTKCCQAGLQLSPPCRRVAGCRVCAQN
jgi:hypothetical protein